MKGVLTAVVLVVGAALPLAGQSASARMTASVTVVEPVSVGGGEVSVAEAPGGRFDVSRPLAVGGRAPWVVRVVMGDAIDAARALQRVPPSHARAGSATEGEIVAVRMPLTAGGTASRPLAYVVSIVN